MNILVLNYEFPPLGGGAAPVSRNLAVGMAEAGHKVTVVTMGFPGLPAEEEIQGVRVIRVKCWRKHAHSSMPWEHLTYILSAISFLRRHLKTDHYDVCHTHFIIPTGPVAHWLKQYAGIPYVLTAHGSDVEGHNRRTYMRVMHRLLRPFWRQIVRAAYAVAAPSDYLIQLMRKNFDFGRYVLVPNGIDSEKYRTTADQKEKRILLMGRMQPNKGFQTILKAISLIPAETWGDWHADILGDGPQKAELERMAEELNIHGRVAFHGWIDNGTPEQVAFVRKGAIFVSASQFENCPMTVLEALAAGCFPLLSDIEGHRQFFRNDENGDQYFFPVDDAEKLAEKLAALLSKEPADLYRSFDITNYDSGHVTERYLTMLQNATRSGIG